MPGAESRSNLAPLIGARHEKSVYSVILRAAVYRVKGQILTLVLNPVSPDLS